MVNAPIKDRTTILLYTWRRMNNLGATCNRHHFNPKIRKRLDDTAEAIPNLYITDGIRVWKWGRWYFSRLLEDWQRTPEGKKAVMVDKL